MIKKFFEDLTVFKTINDIPDLPILSKTEYNEIVVPNLIRCGAIPKKDLVVDNEYLGKCRNSKKAVWKGDHFEYLRSEFGCSYIEKVNHFEDDNGYDLFIPIKKIMNTKLRDDFKNMFFRFCREHNVSPGSKDIKEIIRGLDEWLHTSETHEENNFTPVDKDFTEFHESIVQGCIDYINSHPKIKEEIDKKKKELEEEWNEGYTGEYKLIPDTRVFFSVDGLESSLEAGHWVPATDSSLSIDIGGISVILSI